MSNRVVEMVDDLVVRQLPINSDQINFENWDIFFNQSTILKSVCRHGQNKSCEKDAIDCCELCTYRYALEDNGLTHLPDMVFHKNVLKLKHRDGATIEFGPMDALKAIQNARENAKIQVACAQEWKESRSECHLKEKFKPFDWTFTTDYQGTLNEKIRIENTNEQLNKFKLMQREKILFYHDLTLFEDELHDHGISSCSVKIRVMPSGFFILLRHFLRIDDVQIKMSDTRFHFEVENNYIFKEFTKRGATYAELKNAPPAFFTSPNEIEGFVPIIERQAYKLYFK